MPLIPDLLKTYQDGAQLYSDVSTHQWLNAFTDCAPLYQDLSADYHDLF